MEMSRRASSAASSVTTTSDDHQHPYPQQQQQQYSHFSPDLAPVALPGGGRRRRSTITAIINPLNLFSSSRNTSTRTSPILEATDLPGDTTTTTTSNKMSRTSTRMQRSQSQSQATSPYVLTHHSHTLGQGATIVRTPQDATMFMTQANPAWVSRNSSLRETAAPQRPPRQDDDGTEFLAPRSTSTSPPQTHERSASSNSVLQFNPMEKAAPTRPLLLARSPSAPTVQTTTRRMPVDSSSGYQPTRRLTSRASASTLQRSPPPRACPASPSSGASSASISLVSLAEAFTASPIHKGHRTRPSNASHDTLTPLPSLVPTNPTPPILISRNTRPSPDSGSAVLVTLRFGFSLDAEPNTHSVTVTMDTLKPAGGRIVNFLEQSLRTSTRSITPITPGSAETMTDGSSAEDSDFELDENVLHMRGTPPPRPPRRKYSASGLPPLSDLPAALAKAKADREMEGSTRPRAASAATSRSEASTSASASVSDAESSGLLTEITVLLQRDASAWHAIASRLCAGQWPSLDGKRRRVEEECRWAGMGGLLDELRSVKGSAYI